MSASITAIILTRDEELNIRGCLESLSWCEDLVVLDSGSTDATVAIAEECKARVYHNPFKAFGDQRNWALANCELTTDWILFLDADERSTSEFMEATQAITQNAGENIAGFYCCWKTFLNDKWIRRCDGFPRWQFRLLRRGSATFEDFGHSQRETEVNGQIEYLREPYHHFPFSKGWENWLSRHNNYSTQEALSRLEYQGSVRELFAKHPAKRIKYLKTFVSKIPGWPIAYFFIRFILKGGFLDGFSGLIFCLNMTYYEFLIQIKMAELRQTKHKS